MCCQPISGYFSLSVPPGAWKNLWFLMFSGIMTLQSGWKTELDFFHNTGTLSTCVNENVNSIKDIFLKILQNIFRKQQLQRQSSRDIAKFPEDQLWGSSSPGNLMHLNSFRVALVQNTRKQLLLQFGWLIFFFELPGKISLSKENLTSTIEYID